MPKKNDTTFKYNTFPNPNDGKSILNKSDFTNKAGSGNGLSSNATSQEGKIKLDEAENVNTMLKEFEANLNVIEKTKDEMVKKLKTSTELVNKLQQQPPIDSKEKRWKCKEAIGRQRQVKKDEKELLEIISELEKKSQEIEKQLNEIQNKGVNKPSTNGSNNATPNQELIEKKKSHYEKVLGRFNKFKEEFKNEKQVLHEVNQKIEELHIR